MPSSAVRRIVIAVITVICMGLAGVLGAWQWSRAQHQGLAIDPIPAPIHEVMQPATLGGEPIGRTVEVSGEWGSGVALIPDREIDGDKALLLIREFTVAADVTGTGESATLMVLVGWASPEDPAVPADLAGVPATLIGYIRAGEAPSPPGVPVPSPAVDGVEFALAMSPAQFASSWPSPLYTLVLVSPDGTGLYTELPFPEPQTQLRLQNLAYAIEWWVFGLFAAVVGVRMMRDNGAQEDG